MATIGIVTVLYNSATVLEEYFKTLSEQTYKDFILYVVDNKSPDDSLALSYKFAELYKNIFKTVIIENDQNFGVARGNNIGVKKAINDGCINILLSNNDVVFNPNCIEQLVNGLDEYDWDAITPKILFHNTNLIWYAGGSFAWLTGGAIHWDYLKENSLQNDIVKVVDYAPTCVMLINRSVFDKVGLFDERYFVYYDDTDWLYRCKLSGIRVGYYPKALLWHKESTSTGGMKSDFYLHYNNRNKMYFCRKFYSFFHTLLVFIVSALKELPCNNSRQRKIIFKSLFEGLRM